MVGRWAEIHEREYLIQRDGETQDDLTLRPIQLRRAYHSWQWRNWTQFTKLVKEFQIGDDWKKRRNKLKEARLVCARRMPKLRILRICMASFQVTSLNISVRQVGWYNNQCAYFDD